MSTSEQALREEYARLQARLREIEKSLSMPRSDSKQAEGRQRLFRTLLDSSSDGIEVIDPVTHRFLDVNETECRRLGYSREELLSMSIEDVDPDFKSGAGKAIRKAIEETGSARFEAVHRCKDGSTFPVEVSVSRKVIDKPYLLAIVRDVSERKRTEQMVQDEKKFSETLIQSQPDIFFLLDSQAGLLRWNRRLQELLGLPPEEMAGTNALAFIHDDDRPLVAQKLQQAFETGSASVQARLNLVDGLRHYALTGNRVKTSLGMNIIGVGIDITERRQAELDIRESEERFRTIFDEAPMGIALINSLTGAICEVNSKFAAIVGRTQEEMATIDWMSITHPDDVQEDLDNMARLNAGEIDGFHMNKRYLRPDGSFVWINMTVAPIQVKDKTHPRHLCMIEDITGQKEVESAVRLSRDLLRSVVENIPMRVFWKDRELRYLGCNTVFARDAGKDKPKDVYGKDDTEMGWPEQAELYRKDDRRVMDSGKPELNYEEPQTTPDGRTIWLRTSKVPLRDAEGEVSGILGIYDDITEWRETESKLALLNRALKALSACNRALVHSSNEEELLQGVCRAVVEGAGYLLAWVGYAQQDEEKSVRVMGSYAVKPGYAENVRISWADVPEGRGPSGTSLRLGETQYIQDIAHDPAMQPWRDNALSYGYRASVSLPLKEDGVAFGVLTIYAPEANAFDAEALALLEEMAEDLGYGIHMQRIGAEREQHANILQRSLEQSIQTIAETVAARDPYTAGHQRRVGDLATAIAREMGLPEIQVNGIHLAGIIHDLGKIHIPAEILSKPGKLNDIEYMMIKTHPQAGYDILKDVQFPWPIADIVLQHHEKLDGSGYPQGLKQGEILLEARILCVADVVEAMSSHRPYRAGLGLESALEEIRNKRGLWFDPAVVDACLRLFREKGYELPV